MIVLDASAAVALLLDHPPDVAARLGRRIGDGQESIVVVPHLLDLEVTQVLRRFLSRGEATQERAVDALDKLADLPAARYPHWPLLGRIWELRNSLTAYDAAYVALAEILNAPLLTLDRRISMASGHHAQVETF